jgi:hypothetical protein
MASTPEQIKQRTDALYEDFISDFKPLYLAVIELKRLMGKRIFGTGTSGGSNTAGQKLPSIPYSTTPIYVSSSTIQDAPSKFKFGKPRTVNGKTKKGKPIKSLYFEGGYAQLKSQTSRKLPLELTGFLKGGFFEQEVITEGLTAGIGLPDSESDKAEGLQFGNRNFKGYGAIFQPTKEEQDEFLEDHAQLLVQSIVNALNKQ